MAWPQAPDYFEAIQNPRWCFRDDELRAGRSAVNALGLPMPRSGNFADVYQIRSSSGDRSWAVKCFTRAVPDLQSRYRRISAYLRQIQPAFAVGFRFLDEGIRLHGHWYPVLKMPWIEGDTLQEFVRRYLDKPAILNGLSQIWLRLARELRQAGVAHGDLQHGNVLLVPGRTAASIRLKLIDYDGMFVPALAREKPTEVGHPAYQHPQRIREGTYGPEADRFSHLVIYCALRGLAALGKALWERYDDGDNLLFREQDFGAPSTSPLFQELWNQGSAPEVRALAGYLIVASQAPFDGTPLLENLVSEGEVRELTPDQEDQVRQWMAVKSRKVRQVPPPAAVDGNAEAAPPSLARWWESADPPEARRSSASASQVASSAPPQRPLGSKVRRYKRNSSP